MEFLRRYSDKGRLSWTHQGLIPSVYHQNSAKGLVEISPSFGWRTKKRLRRNPSCWRVLSSTHSSIHPCTTTLCQSSPKQGSQKNQQQQCKGSFVSCRHLAGNKRWLAGFPRFPGEKLFDWALSDLLLHCIVVFLYQSSPPWSTCDSSPTWITSMSFVIFVQRTIHGTTSSHCL